MLPQAQGIERPEIIRLPFFRADEFKIDNLKIGNRQFASRCFPSCPNFPVISVSQLSELKSEPQR